MTTLTETSDSLPEREAARIALRLALLANDARPFGVQPQKAISCYNRAPQVDSKFADAYVGRALAEQSEGKLDDAAADYKRALRINSHSASAHNDYATLLYEKGDPDGAIADYDKAIAIEPDPECYNNRAVAHARNGDLAAAINDYSAAIVADPTLVAVRFNRGRARLLAGDMDSAIADFSTAIAQRDQLAKQADYLPEGATPDKVIYNSYVQRGLAWEGKQNYANANKDYTAAIETMPNAPLGYANRGRTYLEQNQLGLALADLDKAISISPNLAMPHMDRGLALLAQGERAEADREFQRCLTLDAKLKSLLEKRVENLKQEHAVVQKRPTAQE